MSSLGEPSATTRPRSTITTRSATFSASCRSWVVTSTQAPAWRRSSMTWRTTWRPPASMPAVGSSRNTTSGPAHEREGEGEPLLLTAGEGAPGRLPAVLEAHPVEQRLGILGIGVERGEQPEHLEGPDARVHAAALQHHPDGPRQALVVGRPGRGRAPGPGPRSAGGSPRGSRWWRSSRRRWARAARRPRPPSAWNEMPVDGRHRAVAHDQVVDLDHGHSGTLSVPVLRPRIAAAGYGTGGLQRTSADYLRPGAGHPCHPERPRVGEGRLRPAGGGHRGDRPGPRPRRAARGR